METESVRQCLNSIACSPEQIRQITDCLKSDHLPEAKQKMRQLRCELIEAMHESQRRVDQLDWLLRNMERTVKD